MGEKKSLWHFVLLGLALLGLLDSGYLTFEHYQPVSSVVCLGGIWSDCGRVLRSSYATILGVPLAVLGFVYYSVLVSAGIGLVFGKNKSLNKYLFIILTGVGFVFSLYFVYLQLVVIGKMCIYCMASGFISSFLFLLSLLIFEKERKILFLKLTHFMYLFVVRRILFLFKSDSVHEGMVSFCQFIGRVGLGGVLGFFLKYEDIGLCQKIKGVDFINPIGLAAGFDYEGKLTRVLTDVGFGFQTVGTVTNMAYEGNPPPRLGRLPKSRSLLVNKGFKSSGVGSVIEKLAKTRSVGVFGVSVGRSNSAKLKTQKQSISDIVTSFKKLEKAKLDFLYYELNISCPNLIYGGNITFYVPEKLDELLSAVGRLNLTRPVFVKMPITESDRDTLAMVKVIRKHNIAGVVIGNLWKDRKSVVFDRGEIEKAGLGNFSGLPTQERSNELIELVYKNYGKKLVVIGCGGVFNAKDAYEKIRRGASLVQMVTGLVYEGPQLAAEINAGLVDLLAKDGFTKITEAVGSIVSFQKKEKA